MSFPSLREIIIFIRYLTRPPNVFHAEKLFQRRYNTPLISRLKVSNASSRERNTYVNEKPKCRVLRCKGLEESVKSWENGVWKLGFPSLFENACVQAKTVTWSIHFVSAREPWGWKLETRRGWSSSFFKERNRAKRERVVSTSLKISLFTFSYLVSIDFRGVYIT